MFFSRSFIVSDLTLRFKSILSLLLCMVLESVLVSFFYKWLTSFPSTTLQTNPLPPPPCFPLLVHPSLPSYLTHSFCFRTLPKPDLPTISTHSRVKILARYLEHQCFSCKAHITVLILEVYVSSLLTVYFHSWAGSPVRRAGTLWVSFIAVTPVSSRMTRHTEAALLLQE